MVSNRSQIHKPNPDKRIEFGQEELATQIAKQIKNDRNIHIAVNGPWGSGKTTVLDQTHEKFEEENDTISVWYEPWRYGPDQTTLRRTFLKSLDQKVADHVGKDPILELDRFHFPNIDFEPKSAGDFLGDFIKTFRAQLNFIVVFSFLIGLIFLIGFGLVVVDISWITSSIGAILVLCSFVLFTGLIVYLRNDLGSELASTTTFEVKEPKISEIDLFEKQYKNVLDRAQEEEKSIVVFIDDIDRCSPREIREVMTGLTTYLDPGEDTAHIAFVAAIDGPKVVEAFQTELNDQQDDEQELVDPNIVNKTFQVVIPVPPLSRQNIVELIKLTGDELGYSISDANAERMAMTSVAYANSNLRTIRSGIAEVQWMKEIGSDYLQEFGYQDSRSFNQLLNSDYALFRIALIKLLSKDEDLRRFVTDASWWWNDERNGAIEWELFDLQPKFGIEGLDPRPFLALNSPNDSVAGVDDIGGIKDDVRKGNRSQALELIEKHDSPSKMHVCGELLDIEFSSLDLDEKSNIINIVSEIMAGSLDSVDADSYRIFGKCIEELKSDNEIIDNIQRDDYDTWIKIANIIGDDAIDDIVADDSPFIQQDENRFLKTVIDVAPDYGTDFVGRLLEIEIENARSDPVNSANRVKQLFEKDIITESNLAPEYLLTVIEEWDFDEHEDGPPEALLNKDVVKSIKRGEDREKAAKLYSTRVPEGTEFKDSMYDARWPGRLGGSSKFDDEEETNQSEE